MSKDRHKNRAAHNFIDLTGQKFGKLTVLADTGKRKSRRPIWSCLCDCGNTTTVLGKYLRNGDTASCGKCDRGPSHNRDAVGEITKSFWTPIEKQALRRGIPFSISREEAWALFVSQDRRCALSGVLLLFSTNIRDQRGKHTASLDRIESHLGYSLGNVQWVHKRINIMKNTMSQEELLEWCGLILKNHDRLPT